MFCVTIWDLPQSLSAPLLSSGIYGENAEICQTGQDF